MSAIISDILGSSGFWTFSGIALSLLLKNQADKKRANDSDVKISDIDKKQTSRIDKLSSELRVTKDFVFEMKDNSKHEKFTKSLINSLTAESYTYISDFQNIDDDIKSFLLQRTDDVIAIYRKILDSGFENYNKQIVTSQFNIASKNIALRFSSSTELINIITSERNEFIHNLDVLMNSKVVNGIRRGKFERICRTMLLNIIKKVTTLNSI